MDSDAVADDLPIPDQPDVGTSQIPDQYSDEIDKIRNDFQQRLIVAGFQTEAVRAGMIDLDGLKLIDLSKARLGPDDQVIGGRQIMSELRRTKPWLFGTSSSSSVADAPTSKPTRQKSALEMSEKEYLAARAALTRRRY